MSEKRFVTENILEVRHLVSGKFLDVKGGLADYVKDKNIFQQWSIQENIINFFDTNKQRSAVLAPNKIAFIVSNPPTSNYFKDQASAFLKNVFENKKNIYDVPTINRLGVRVKCFIKSENSFEDICECISNTYFNKNAIGGLGGIRTELQFTHTLKEKEYDIRITVAPLRKNEASRYFTISDDQFEKTGFYVDVDCFQLKELRFDKVHSLFVSAIKLIAQKIDNISAAIDI